MSAPNPELSDHQVYDWLNFEHDTFWFYFKAVKVYASLLERDMKMVTEDEDLRALLGDRRLDSFPIARVNSHVKKMRN